MKFANHRSNSPKPSSVAELPFQIAPAQVQAMRVNLDNSVDHVHQYQVSSYQEQHDSPGALVMTAQTAANAAAVGGTLQPISLTSAKKSSIATLSAYNHNSLNNRHHGLPAPSYRNAQDIIRPNTNASAFTNESLG